MEVTVCSGPFVGGVEVAVYMVIVKSYFTRGSRIYIA